MREKKGWTPGFGPAGRPKPAIYPREKANQVGNRKWVRLSIVAGYLLSVSLAAVILTVYYGFIWTPGPAQNRTRTRTGEHTWTQTEAESGSGAAGAAPQKNCLTDRNHSVNQPESHVTSRSNQITSPVSPGVTPVPPVRSTGASEASRAGQGATSAAPSSAEPPVVTAEDPSNLPTHRSARDWDQEPDPG
ncbi:putative transmembrane protein INAFM2 [Austrofundulus limnaeus]|uniref:Transmembrane protein INAFM2 n=1 Tax=Austrofundulus limnaeus TaxID=52670 RepID=A0A2I4CH77_AUSLI|nr:PREDICTED: putative transmembrane protein INAFM2 [Austrofundulus limnaeus]